MPRWGCTKYACSGASLEGSEIRDMGEPMSSCVCAQRWAGQLAPKAGTGEHRGHRWGTHWFGYKKADCMKRQCHSSSWKQDRISVWMSL